MIISRNESMRVLDEVRIESLVLESSAIMVDLLLPLPDVLLDCHTRARVHEGSHAACCSIAQCTAFSDLRSWSAPSQDPSFAEA